MHGKPATDTRLLRLSGSRRTTSSSSGEEGRGHTVVQARCTPPPPTGSSPPRRVCARAHTSDSDSAEQAPRWASPMIYEQQQQRQQLAAQLPLLLCTRSPGSSSGSGSSTDNVTPGSAPATTTAGALRDPNPGALRWAAQQYAGSRSSSSSGRPSCQVAGSISHSCPSSGSEAGGMSHGAATPFWLRWACNEFGRPAASSCGSAEPGGSRTTSQAESTYQQGRQPQQHYLPCSASAQGASLQLRRASSSPCVSPRPAPPRWGAKTQPRRNLSQQLTAAAAAAAGVPAAAVRACAPALTVLPLRVPPEMAARFNVPSLAGDDCSKTSGV